MPRQPRPVSEPEGAKDLFAAGDTAQVLLARLHLPERSDVLSAITILQQVYPVAARLPTVPVVSHEAPLRAARGCLSFMLDHAACQAPDDSRHPHYAPLIQVRDLLGRARDSLWSRTPSSTPGL